EKLQEQLDKVANERTEKDAQLSEQAAQAGLPQFFGDQDSLRKLSEGLIIPQVLAGAELIEAPLPPLKHRILEIARYIAVLPIGLMVGICVGMATGCLSYADLLSVEDNISKLLVLWLLGIAVVALLGSIAALAARGFALRAYVQSLQHQQDLGFRLPCQGQEELPSTPRSTAALPAPIPIWLAMGAVLLVLGMVAEVVVGGLGIHELSVQYASYASRATGRPVPAIPLYLCMLAGFIISTPFVVFKALVAAAELREGILANYLRAKAYVLKQKVLQTGPVISAVKLAREVIRLRQREAELKAQITDAQAKAYPTQTASPKNAAAPWLKQRISQLEREITAAEKIAEAAAVEFSSLLRKLAVRLEPLPLYPFFASWRRLLSRLGAIPTTAQKG
ncbi:MAG: hypothetical protein H5T86_16320, partial [Armatimonadetes bacterium]|nr:hypothetical protein [Armatimonadota bacterium]